MYRMALMSIKNKANNSSDLGELQDLELQARVIVDNLAATLISSLDAIECFKVIAAINIKKVKLIEVELDQDIDGDGKIG